MKVNCWINTYNISKPSCFCSQHIGRAEAPIQNSCLSCNIWRRHVDMLVLEWSTLNLKIYTNMAGTNKNVPYVCIGWKKRLILNWPLAINKITIIGTSTLLLFFSSNMGQVLDGGSTCKAWSPPSSKLPTLWSSSVADPAGSPGRPRTTLELGSNYF